MSKKEEFYPVIISLPDSKINEIRDKYNLKRNHRVETLIDLFVLESIKNGTLDKFIEDKFMSYSEEQKRNTTLLTNMYDEFRSRF